MEVVRYFAGEDEEKLVVRLEVHDSREEVRQVARRACDRFAGILKDQVERKRKLIVLAD